MDSAWLADTLCQFIEIPSVTGNEAPAIAFLEKLFEAHGWHYELLPFDDTRNNIFVSFGSPKVVFTTHVDVVPAPPELFVASCSDGIIRGRGSNDAKGIVICMIAAAQELLSKGATDFGLLFVCEEETTGNGAVAAAAALKDRGIEFLINGEPTDNALALAHKGGLGCTLRVTGRSCHSGYPELGDDAIATLIDIVGQLYQTPFGEDEVLGNATITVGTIQGGTASNVVSDSAECQFLIRTVVDNDTTFEIVQKIVGDRGTLEKTYNAPPTRLHVVEGFPTCVASYSTDVPGFAALNAQVVLCGPGTIHRAHTDQEHILLSEMEAATETYVALYKAVSG